MKPTDKEIQEALKNKRKFFNNSKKRAILAKTGHKCGRCGKMLNIDTMTIEHIWPVSKGGLDDEYNLIALCEGCNIEKANLVYPVKWYRHILPEHIDSYVMYNGYVSCRNPARMIVPYDVMTYNRVSPDKLELAQRLAKKGNMDSVKRLMSRAELIKAFPGDAKEIYTFMQQCASRKNLIKQPFYHNNEYCVYDDICAGEVYILKNAAGLCGVYAFRPIEPDSLPPQLLNTAEELGLKVRMAMTAAVGSKTGGLFHPDIMDDLFRWQIARGELPVYFGILGDLFKEKNRYIALPYKFMGHDGMIEAHTLKYFHERFREYAKDICYTEGYLNKWEPTEEDIDRYGELFLMYRKLSDIPDNDREFLDSRPGLATYFEPDDYEGYARPWIAKHQKEEST